LKKFKFGKAQLDKRAGFNLEARRGTDRRRELGEYEDQKIKQREKGKRGERRIEKSPPSYEE